VLIMACDPGLRFTGVAAFQDGELVWAGGVKNPVLTERGPGAWRAMARKVRESYPLAPDILVLEGQYVSPRANPADILELCGVIGALTGMYDEHAADIIRYLPNQWTGGIKKENRHVVLQSELSPEELALIDMPAPSLRHNVWDAVGLALFEVKMRGERIHKHTSEDAMDEDESEVA
jgi:hypothetical protein